MQERREISQSNAQAAEDKESRRSNSGGKAAQIIVQIFWGLLVVHSVLD